MSDRNLPVYSARATRLAKLAYDEHREAVGAVNAPVDVASSSGGIPVWQRHYYSTMACDALLGTHAGTRLGADLCKLITSLVTIEQPFDKRNDDRNRLFDALDAIMDAGADASEEGIPSLLHAVEREMMPLNPPGCLRSFHPALMARARARRRAPSH